jgi:hypothetical protein
MLLVQLPPSRRRCPPQEREDVDTESQCGGMDGYLDLDDAVPAAYIHFPDFSLQIGYPAIRLSGRETERRTDEQTNR